MTARLVSADSDSGKLPDVVLYDLETRFLGKTDSYTKTQADARFKPMGYPDYTKTVHVADTAGISGYGWVSDGTATEANSQLRHNVPADVSELQFVYVNSTAYTDGANPITVRASLVFNGSYSPVYFNGQRDIVIAPGARVVSDPVPVSTIGTTPALPFLTRTRVSVAAGQSWPITIETVSTRNEGFVESSTGDDLTLAGTIPVRNNGRAYGPVGLIGKTSRPDRDVIALIGDSITGGVGGTVPNWYNGFSRLATAAKGKVSINVGYPGSAAGRGFGFAFRNRAVVILGATHSIEMYGTNDIATASFASMQATAIYNWRDRMARGIRVYACSLIPRVTSTDSYATLANQADSAGNSTVRVQYNDWLRSGAPVTAALAATTADAAGAIKIGDPGHPVNGYFETADAVESSRNSGKWKVDGTAGKYTADGVHPTAFGHQVMADALIGSWPESF